MKELRSPLFITTAIPQKTGNGHQKRMKLETLWMPFVEEETKGEETSATNATATTTFKAMNNVRCDFAVSMAMDYLQLTVPASDSAPLTTDLQNQCSRGVRCGGMDGPFNNSPSRSVQGNNKT